MRFQVTCGVDSATFLDGQFVVEVDELSYTFIPDEHGRLIKIAITAPVLNVEKFRSEITENPTPGVKAEIIHNTDKELFDRLIAEFQRLESHIAFSFRLDGIHWQNPKIETICENAEERAIAKIFELQITRTPRENPVSVSSAEMAKLIVGSRKYAHLTAPMSFYREGMNEYKSQRYITAFFNFYFILEGLFGRGKTKNRQIEQEFKASSGLRWAIERGVEATQEGRPKVFSRFAEELTHAGRSVTTNGVIEHLVSTRGRLHHFTHSQTRLEGTPFTNSAFEPVAELARAFTTFSIMHFVMEINNGRSPSA